MIVKDYGFDIITTYFDVLYNKDMDINVRAVVTFDNKTDRSDDEVKRDIQSSLSKHFTIYCKK